MRAAGNAEEQYLPKTNWTLCSSLSRTQSWRGGHTWTPFWEQLDKEAGASRQDPLSKDRNEWMSELRATVSLAGFSPFLWGQGRDGGGGGGGGAERQQCPSKWHLMTPQLEVLSNKWRVIYPTTTRDGCSQGWNQGGCHKVSPGGFVTLTSGQLQWEISLLVHILALVWAKNFKLCDIKPDIER